MQIASKVMAAAAKRLPMHDALQRSSDATLATSQGLLADVAAASTSPFKNVPEGAKPVKAKAPASKAQPFGRLLRSKGVVWIAGENRYDLMGEWSLAGVFGTCCRLCASRSNVVYCYFDDDTVHLCCWGAIYT